MVTEINFESVWTTDSRYIESFGVVIYTDFINPQQHYLNNRLYIQYASLVSSYICFALCKALSKNQIIVSHLHDLYEHESYAWSLFIRFCLSCIVYIKETWRQRPLPIIPCLQTTHDKRPVPVCMNEHHVFTNCAELLIGTCSCLSLSASSPTTAMWWPPAFSAMQCLTDTSLLTSSLTRSGHTLSAHSLISYFFWLYEYSSEYMFEIGGKKLKWLRFMGHSTLVVQMQAWLFSYLCVGQYLKL